MNRSRTHSKLPFQRYIYKTRGVCPPEIHFELHAGVLRQLRFVGGGCPGNALLVARLLEGRRAGKTLQVLNGIACRNATSCPDQLALALQAALSGTLQPAASFRVRNDHGVHVRIGLIAEPAGNLQVLEDLVRPMAAGGVTRIYCVGDLIGGSVDDRLVPVIFHKHNIQPVLGPSDWRCIQEKGSTTPSVALKTRDVLRQLPHLASFRLGPKTGIVFHGEYLQQLPDYSDFEPFAVEINTVCGLTACMQDESVFPALAAMTPQFEADIIVFGQSRRWGHWQVGGKDFISLGPASDDDGLCWGLLEWIDGRVRFEPRSTA